MKKDYYFWIFIAVAVVLCVSLLSIVFKMNDDVKLKGESNNVPISSESRESKNNPVVVEEVDLTKENVDFEEDATDLSEDFIDDSSFDIEPNVDSIENEIQ